MKVLKAISALFSAVLFSMGAFAQSQRMAHINVRNDQHTEVITNNLSDQTIDDGCIVVIPGGRDRGSLVVSPEQKYAVGRIPHTANVDADGKVRMSGPTMPQAESPWRATRAEKTSVMPTMAWGGSSAVKLMGSARLNTPTTAIPICSP